MASSTGAQKRVHRIVLTGGPCGGKTTALERLTSFFEVAGWKVYRVPEAATILINGGAKFETDAQRMQFQEEILLTAIHLEDSFIRLAEKENKNVIIIMDRGTMDCKAYLRKADWETVLAKTKLDEVGIRDMRYDQVVHLETAAIGAKNYYTLSTNTARTETAEKAAELDEKTRLAWIGHRCFEIITNAGVQNFEEKILKTIQAVADKAGITYGSRLAPESRKRKFLVSEIKGEFPPFQEFTVTLDVLLEKSSSLALRSPQNVNDQVRLRKRGRDGKYRFTRTERRTVDGKRIETRRQLSKIEYEDLKKMADTNRKTVEKRTRCFLVGSMYCQLDIYKAPIRGLQSLMILETYSTDDSPAFIKTLPPFLKIEREITNDSNFSLYTLALK